MELYERYAGGLTAVERAGLAHLMTQVSKGQDTLSSFSARLFHRVSKELEKMLAEAASIESNMSLYEELARNLTAMAEEGRGTDAKAFEQLWG